MVCVGEQTIVAKDKEAGIVNAISLLSSHASSYLARQGTEVAYTVATDNRVTSAAECVLNGC